jgi:hypothetical protein
MPTNKGVTPTLGKLDPTIRLETERHLNAQEVIGRQGQILYNFLHPYFLMFLIR